MPDQWFAIIDKDGALVSTGSVIADEATLVANGFTALPIDGPPDGRDWDAQEKKFVAPPAEATVLSKLGFVQRFTAQEFIAIRSDQDANVQFFLYQLENADTVMPSHPVVQQGIAYLTSMGLLTPERAAQIGAE